MRNSTLALFALSTLVASTRAEERTWTIARDVYSAEGELVAVRGRTAFLQIDGRVEAIPLEQLSAADLAYLDSLELAPLRPDAPLGANQPASDEAAAGPAFPGNSNRDVSQSTASDAERSLIVPASSESEFGAAGEMATQAVAEEALPVPPGAESAQRGPNAQQRQERARAVGETWPGATQPGGSANRQQLQRAGQDQQELDQQRSNRANTNRRDADDDQDAPRGFFRARRLERLRGSSR